MTNIQSNNTSQSNILFKIENFVKNIIAMQPLPKNDPHIVLSYGVFCCEMLQPFHEFQSVYSPNHAYSEHIEAFWYGCIEHGLLNAVAILNAADHPVSSLSPHKACALAEYIFLYSKNRKFKRRAKDRFDQTVLNEKSLKAYATALHKKYSRLLVVRVDFCYRTESQHLVGIDDVCRHLSSFIRMKATSDIFEYEAGNAWTIEQGEDKGYHIHTAFYFKGSNVQDDKYKATQIGLLWIDVTDGLGYYYRSNNTASKKRFEAQETLGIGMIHRRDPFAVNNSIEAVSYLADPDKVDQYLRMKPKGTRTFQTGML